MGIILRNPCGCALCKDSAAFYEERRNEVKPQREAFEAMIQAADPPRYYGMITQLRVGTRWPGIDIDQPRSDNWIRDCIEGA